MHTLGVSVQSEIWKLEVSTGVRKSRSPVSVQTVKNGAAQSSVSIDSGTWWSDVTSTRCGLGSEIICNSNPPVCQGIY
jgi:hypothetical protein